MNIMIHLKAQIVDFALQVIIIFIPHYDPFIHFCIFLEKPSLSTSPSQSTNRPVKSFFSVPDVINIIIHGYSLVMIKKSMIKG